MIIKCPCLPNFEHYKKFTFPAGELHLELSNAVIMQDVVDITFKFKTTSDIFELLLLADTLKNNRVKIRSLHLEYMPFGQADRINHAGECFSLRLFCNLINNIISPLNVFVYDPHSDVTPALLNNCVVIHQWDILAPIIEKMYPQTKNSFYLVCPDAGAEKKVNKLSQLLQAEVVYCRKVRSTVYGTITGTEVYKDDFGGVDAVIVDDMVVGGRTYIEIARILRTRNVGKIILVTTNGVYSKGLDVFGNIDEIYNQYGRVKPEMIYE